MGLKIGWGRASGNHQGGAHSMSQVDGVSDMVPTCWLCGSVGVVPEKEQWPLPHFCFFCLGESCPLTLTLIPDNSVHPYMSLIPFNLLPPHWSSEEVISSKSVLGPFKRNCVRL